MGLLDNLRDKISGNFGRDYDDYDDDYYDDDEYDDYEEPQGSGILGNTSRPEAESVAVYTRSGRPVGTNAGVPAQQESQSRSSGRPNASYASYRRAREDYEDGFDDYGSSRRPTSPVKEYNTSGQLPPYVLEADSYEDVQTVVRRVRTNQPVMLVLNNTPGDVAQRILDFCFGLSFGIDGEVQPVEGKVFLVLPAGIQPSPNEIDRLLAQVS